MSISFGWVIADEGKSPQITIIFISHVNIWSQRSWFFTAEEWNLSLSLTLNNNRGSGRKKAKIAMSTSQFVKNCQKKTTKMQYKTHGEKPIPKKKKSLRFAFRWKCRNVQWRNLNRNWHYANRAVSKIQKISLKICTWITWGPKQ